MMGDDYLTNPLEFLISTLFSLYIMAVMLRFLLGLVRADFYNPVSQFLVRITNPLLIPCARSSPASASSILQPCY
jgi:YggT family protein